MQGISRREFLGGMGALTLQQHGLTFVALSSGDIHMDPALEADDLALHTRNAKFLRDAGGLYLQIIDKPPKDRSITQADYKHFAQLLAEVGKRVADVGTPQGYHNQMNTLSESPENLDRILDAADPRHVKLELDVAHYLEGGGDPVKAIDKYHDRLLFLHLKDVRDANPEGTRGAPDQLGGARSRQSRFARRHCGAREKQIPRLGGTGSRSG